MHITPQQLDRFAFACYYIEGRREGWDHWESLWHCLNYLPVRVS
jgi:hypothetical protein